MRHHERVFGPVMRDAIYIPSPIEKGKFHPNDAIEKKKYLYAGVLMGHKGVVQILDWAEATGKKLDFAGREVSKLISD